MRFISLIHVMDMLKSNDNLKSIEYEQVIIYALKFLSLIGIPDYYQDTLFKGRIRNYRVKIKCDYESNLTVTINGKIAYPASDISQVHLENINSRPNGSGNYDNPTFKGIFKPQDTTQTGMYTYKISDDTLFANIPSGDITIQYSAVMVDEKGEIMIPGERLFIDALERYIKYCFYEVQFEQGKLDPRIFNHVEQEYMWAVGKLEASTKMLDYGEAAVLLNNLKTIINRPFSYGNRFASNPSKTTNNSY